MKSALLLIALSVMTCVFPTDKAEAAIANESNRPQVLVPVALSADKKIPVLVAHKKMIVRSAKLISTGAIAASGSNYLSMKLQKSTASGATPADVSLNVAVDTQAGVAAYGQLSLDTDPVISLEKGQALYLDADVFGTLTVDAWLSLDIEVAGK